MKKLLRYKLLIFLLLQILLVKVLSYFPEVVERYYSLGFYTKLSGISRQLMGKVGFSVGDCLYFMVGFWMIYRIIKNRKSLNWKSVLLAIGNFVSVFYFLFHLLWGMNYYRVQLDQKMQISYHYELADLLQMTDTLIARTNLLHLQIAQSDSVKIHFLDDEKTIYNKAPNAYSALSKSLPEFTYEYPAVKNSLISTPLTYMGFGGYMNPFTSEAQVNSRIPKLTYPTVTLHEMAHQIGFASESEANMIGYLASMASEDIYFQYSGSVYALRYCLRNIELYNEEVLEGYLKKLSPGLRSNLHEARQFWEAHQTPIESIFKYIYDRFLKINDQKEGLESYSKFVGLLINYEKKATSKL